ncbi:MAG: hypothetical protein ABH864_01070 [archaeon]
MDKQKLIPDSTFLSLFLKCNKINELEKIIDYFDTRICSVVDREISKIFPKVSNSLKKKMMVVNSKLDYFLLMKPFISKEQYEKGEFDVIILAQFCEDMKLKYIVIIDDGPALKLLKRYFPEIAINHRRTGRFLIECFRNYKILNKSETLDLIETMDLSDFRIGKEHITSLKKELEDE